MRLKGLVAIVTGASSGIGARLARMLADAGVKVALAARRKVELERLVAAIEADGGRAIAVPADLRRDDGIRALLDRAGNELGPVDILVNNAAIAYAAPVHLTDMKLWDDAMAVNLRAPASLCAGVLPGMRDRKRGYVINVSSEAGVFAYPHMGSYTVSKHALNALTEVIEKENRQYGIKAWSICPGTVAAPMVSMLPDTIPENFLTVDDIAGVVRDLLMQDDNVRMGPEILIRTMRNPFEKKRQ